MLLVNWCSVQLLYRVMSLYIALYSELVCICVSFRTEVLWKRAITSAFCDTYDISALRCPLFFHDKIQCLHFKTATYSLKLLWTINNWSLNACFPYSTLRATRCAKSLVVRVEKMLPDKFLFVEKRNHKQSRYKLLFTHKKPAPLHYEIKRPKLLQNLFKPIPKEVQCTSQVKDYSQFWEVAQVTKHFRWQAANSIVRQIPIWTKWQREACLTSFSKYYWYCSQYKQEQKSIIYSICVVCFHACLPAKRT